MSREVSEGVTWRLYLDRKNVFKLNASAVFCIARVQAQGKNSGKQDPVFCTFRVRPQTQHSDWLFAVGFYN
jgi:hypothetical protein